jgi:hypothetical protein
MNPGDNSFSDRENCRKVISDIKNVLPNDQGMRKKSASSSKKSDGHHQTENYSNHRVEKDHGNYGVPRAKGF